MVSLQRYTEDFSPKALLLGRSLTVLGGRQFAYTNNDGITGAERMLPNRRSAPIRNVMYLPARSHPQACLRTALEARSVLAVTEGVLAAADIPGWYALSRLVARRVGSAPRATLAIRGKLAGQWTYTRTRADLAGDRGAVQFWSW
jgi:hypothetical protein